MQVFLGGVDGIDGQQLLTLEVVHAEAVGGHVATHRPLVGTGGQARHLQLLVVLVAPKPRRGGEGTILPQQGGGGRFALFGGVLYRFQAQQAAIGQAAGGAVAGSHNRGVTGTATAIHHNATVAFQASGQGQLVVGVHTYAHHHQPGGVYGAIGHLHAGHGTVSAHVQGGDAGIEHQVHAVAAVQFGVPVGQLGCQHAAQQARGGFQHGHGQPFLAGGGSHFQADEATTNHHHGQIFFDAQCHAFGHGIGIAFAAQGQHASGIAPRQRQAARGGAGGQQQAAVGQCGAVGQQHALGRAVDAGYGHAGMQFDVLAGQHFGGAHHQLGRFHVASQPGLGQRRAVVGAIGLIAQHGDAAFVAAAAQGFGGLYAGLSCADDDDTRCCFAHGGVSCCCGVVVCGSRQSGFILV